MVVGTEETAGERDVLCYENLILFLFYGNNYFYLQ